jgi:hypothetical protein
VSTAPPRFTRHLREYTVCLDTVEFLPWWNRQQELTIVRISIIYRLDEIRDRWVWHRTIVYAMKSNGFTAQIRWYPKSKLERVPSWLYDLVDEHEPKMGA